MSHPVLHLSPPGFCFLTVDTHTEILPIPAACPVHWLCHVHSLHTYEQPSIILGNGVTSIKHTVSALRKQVGLPGRMDKERVNYKQHDKMH